MTDVAPALSLHLGGEHRRLDLDAVQRGDGLTHAVITLTGSPLQEGVARPPLSVLFALDVSGSMKGEPLRQVQQTVERIVTLLHPSDHVGAIAWATNPSLIAPVAALDDAHRATLRRRIAGLQAGSGTGLTAAMMMATDQIMSSSSSSSPSSSSSSSFGAPARQVIILLTDGHPTDGTTVAGLAPRLQEARAFGSLVTLGYGANHNADLLAGLARAGGGQYWFIPDPNEASQEFARAIGAQADVVAERIQLQLRPADGVEVLGVLDGSQPRFSSAGLTIDRPDLRAESVHHTVVALRLRPSHDDEAGHRPLLEVIAHHRPVGGTAEHTTSASLQVGLFRGPPQFDDDAAALVALAHAENERGRARREADAGRFDAAAAVLRALQQKLEALPGYRPMSGTPVSEAVEQIIDEIVAYESRPTAAQYLEFRQTNLGVDLAQGGTHVADVKMKSAASKVLLGSGHAAGDFEWALERDGVLGAWQRAAAHELTIGRVPGNDICLAAGNLSRRHARIVQRDGKVIVVDLKTTNGTWVNGKRISTPQVLKPDDEVKLGDVILRVRPLQGT